MLEDDDDALRSPDPIPACSNDMQEIETIEALVRKTRVEKFATERDVSVRLSEAREGGRGGGWIEPVMETLIEKTGLSRARVLELERAERNYTNDLGELVRCAVVAIRQDYRNAIVQDGRLVFEHGEGAFARKVVTAGPDAEKLVEETLVETFGIDSRAFWMDQELATDLVVQALSVPADILQAHGITQPAPDEAFL